MKDARRLADLVSVGPAALRDFARLGITRAAQLRLCDADRLYARLCTATGTRHDPCVRDVFAAAIAQARDPHLPAARCRWWTYSRQRAAR